MTIPVFDHLPNTLSPETFSGDWDDTLAKLNPWGVAVNALGAAAAADAATATTQAGVATAKAVLTAADVVLTHADVVLTHADVVLTHEDVIAAAASAASAAAIAGAFVGTSTTSWTPTVAAGQVFVTQTGEQYTPGTFLSVVSVADPTAWGLGQVTSYTGSNLTLDIQVSNGSGAHADWNISLTGTRGPQGLPGTLSGNAVGPIDMATHAFNEAHGTDIASAAAINLDTATGNLVDVTGTTAITGITLSDGHKRTVRFTDTLTLTNGANLVLLGGANIVTAAGDYAEFYGYAAGVVRMMSFSRAATLAQPMLVSGANIKTINSVSLLGSGDIAVVGVPVGSEVLWPTVTAPTGWLEEDGASLLRAGTYAGLFAVIGTIYGTADATHFNLPDSRGRFPRVWAHGSSNDPDSASRSATSKTGATMSAGDYVGTEQADGLKAHTHNAIYTGTSGSGSIAAMSAPWVASTTTSSTGGNETRPINTYRMMIIKY